MTLSAPPDHTGIVIIGMGLSPDDLTARHLDIIRRADILIAGKRHLAHFSDHPGILKEITRDIDSLTAYIQEHIATRRIVVLASGDPLLFGIGAALIHALGPERVEVHPNISSVAAAFARIKKPWQDARIVSLHGSASERRLLDAVSRGALTAVLTDPVRNPAWIADLLLQHDCRHVAMCVLEQLGAKTEKVGWYPLEQVAREHFSEPSVVILAASSGPGNGGIRPVYPGMPDEAFVHEKGLITKPEIRAVTLSKLKLLPGQVLWDLGAGSGAVGIEASRLVEGGTVVAVEKKSDRIRHIEENRRRCHVHNMDIHQAELPEGLAALPQPDRIFIGGGGVQLDAVLRAAVSYLKPDGVLVVNTVLMDNLVIARRTLAELGFSVETTQIQVSRGKDMPWSQRFEARNPVWIIAAERRAAHRSQEAAAPASRSFPAVDIPAAAPSGPPVSETRYPVQFVGAGPGDPDLITVKGQKALMQADVVIYAGSLVPEALLKWTPSGTQCLNSAPMELEEIIEIMANAWSSGKRVVRLHTGDPSLYGAIFEQMAALDARDIPFNVVPGVTAAFAAAAAMGLEYTLPEISQTLILTRMSGRTPVPESEHLRALAAHQSSMAVYLSISLIDEVAEILSEAYGPEAPCVIAYKVSHPEERIVATSLRNLAETVRRENITRQALIIVGKVLGITLDALPHRSKLYDGAFTHGYRQSREADG
jgi:precorrin-6Y C5,15-methyltransferase (decarboxylating)